MPSDKWALLIDGLCLQIKKMYNFPLGLIISLLRKLEYTEVNCLAEDPMAPIGVSPPPIFQSTSQYCL